MLYLVGLGLGDEKDMTLRGLEVVKKADKVYLESYTSQLSCSKEDLERLYGRKIEIAERKFVEESNKILEESKKKDIVLLVIGSPLTATTHFNFIIEAIKSKIMVEVIDNSSVYTAVGISGLFLYKFGRVVTIPLDNKDVKSPLEVLRNNDKIDAHTLFLLDIKEDKLMSVNEALDYLLGNGMEDRLVVACCGLGCDKFEIKSGKASEIVKEKFNKFPQSLVVPTKKLHFKEEEALDLWR